MIASLKGVLAEKNLADVVVDVDGVGYRVMLSQRALAGLLEGERVSLRIRTIVREDALDLYGFLTRNEEDLFLLLTSVSHVGPKVAMSVLSGLEVSDLIAAIAKGEVARLTKIHGVGRKTAERLVLELKDKMKTLSVETKSAVASPPGVTANLVSALINLGYKQPQAEAAAEAANERAGDGAAFEAVFKEALKVLRG